MTYMSLHCKYKAKYMSDPRMASHDSPTPGFVDHKTYKFKFKFKLSFIVIPLHVGTYSGTKCRASQDHGAT